jgi:hypothetical protein
MPARSVDFLSHGWNTKAMSIPEHASIQSSESQLSAPSSPKTFNITYIFVAFLFLLIGLLGGFAASVEIHSYNASTHVSPVPTPTQVPSINLNTQHPTSTSLLDTPTPQSTISQTPTLACPAPPSCPSGHMIYGDPRPGSKNTCPQYQCSQ